VKFLIADDHSFVRRGIRQILAEEFRAAVILEAASAPEAIQLIGKEHLDLVVLDISLEGQSGLDVLKQAKQFRPNLPVIILTMHPESQYAVRAFRAGAAGYLTKASAPECLVQAVRKALAGGRYVSPALAEQLAVDLSATDKLPHETLSDRE